MNAPAVHPDAAHARSAEVDDVDLTPRRRPFGDRFLLFFALVLLGYSIGGRGFAYVGYTPVFVGEVTLLLGIAAFARSSAWRRTLREPLLWPVFAMAGWGAVRTVPYVGEFGIDALRDAMVWVYSAFAIVLVALLYERPARLAEFVGRYRTFIPWFLLCIPFAFAVYRFSGEARPEWPWVSVPIVQVKEGDVLVHLGGVMAFWASGLGGRTTSPWVMLLTANAAIMGVIDRAGMVAFGAVYGLCVAFKPTHSTALRVVAAVLLAVGLLWASDLRVPIPGGKGRDISFDQVVTNIGSVLGDAGNDGLDSTKEWRVDWWKEISGYTLHGRHFWTGKGFGINLADDDGFQVNADHSLRNPHSAHMTMLARAGVPGVALWAGVQAVWGWAVVNAFLRCRRRGERAWEGLLFFLFAYWLALLINSSFDVFLEGPMGGIWFWTVYGVGLAAVRLSRELPGLLDEPADGRPDGTNAAALEGMP